MKEITEEQIRTYLHLINAYSYLGIKKSDPDKRLEYLKLIYDICQKIIQDLEL